MDRQLPNRIWLFISSGTPQDLPVRCLRFAFSEPPGISIVRFLLWLLPASYKSHLYDNFFTQGDKGFFGIFIYPTLNWQYYSMSEHERERFCRERIWGGQAGKQWHEANKQEFEGDNDKYSESESFLKYRRPLIRQISELLSSNPKYDVICEIGTGNGMFLDCLSNEFPNIRRFVGIDINRKQILANMEAYKNSKLEFFHAEITDWVNTRCENGTIFITVNVFEYFSQSEFKDILELIHDKINPVAIAVSEPINIDLSQQVTSKPRGAAAYSYNYPYLFQQHGYEIFRQELQPIKPDIPFHNEVIMTVTA